MAEAGVNLVSVGIFSWSNLQPSPGRYDFAWLNRVIDILWSAGVAVCLATATASPPPWLTHRHPEILPERADGTRLWPGSRQHYCPSSPAYLDAALDLVDQLARRYGGHDGLALWHVGNEYGCHVPACYCDTSAAAFRAWLAERYKDVDALNQAWSTQFWSQRYHSLDEVLPPRVSPTFPNPAHQLDFARFSSEALERCFAAEADRLREITPDVPVTTNFMGFFKPLDYWRWARHEDLASHDSYPDPADPGASAGAAMAFDLVRSLKDSAPWLLMEQAPSAVNWRPVNAPKPPGVMRAWSYQAIAHGADGVMSFQWRASRGGAEKFHSAMVPHAGPRFADLPRGQRARERACRSDGTGRHPRSRRDGHRLGLGELVGSRARLAPFRAIVPGGTRQGALPAVLGGTHPGGLRPSGCRSGQIPGTHRAGTVPGGLRQPSTGWRHSPTAGATS